MTIPRFCKLCLRRLEDNERDLCHRSECHYREHRELTFSMLATHDPVTHPPATIGDELGQVDGFHFVPRKRVNLNKEFGSLEGYDCPVHGKMGRNRAIMGACCEAAKRLEKPADKPLEALNRAAKKILNDEMLKRPVPLRDDPPRIAFEPSLQPGDEVRLVGPSVPPGWESKRFKVVRKGAFPYDKGNHWILVDTADDKCPELIFEKKELIRVHSVTTKSVYARARQADFEVGDTVRLRRDHPSVATKSVYAEAFGELVGISGGCASVRWKTEMPIQQDTWQLTSLERVARPA